MANNKMSKRLLMALLIATTLAHPTLASADAAEEGAGVFGSDDTIDELVAQTPESAEYDENVIRHASPEFIKHITACIPGRHCIGRILDEILIDVPTSNECCSRLLEKGRQCHIDIAKVFFSFYNFRKYAAEGISRAYQVWDRCYAAVGGAPAPSSY